MRKRHFSLIALAAASLLLTSCLSDDNDNTEYTYYKDTAISALQSRHDEQVSAYHIVDGSRLGVQGYIRRFEV